MDENQMDESESLNQAEGEETSQTSSEEMEALKKKAALAEDYKIRAEKAERLLKTSEKEKKEEPKEVHSDLSTKDVLYLAKADIHEDDLNDVLEWAKFKKISVSEAHKALKGTLDVRNEERKTAATTDTKGGRPSSNISGETLIERARQGKLPEKDEDIEKLAEARMQEKINKK